MVGGRWGCPGGSEVGGLVGQPGGAVVEGKWEGGWGGGGVYKGGETKVPVSGSAPRQHGQLT